MYRHSITYIKTSKANESGLDVPSDLTLSSGETFISLENKKKGVKREGGRKKRKNVKNSDEPDCDVAARIMIYLK